jgi:hypothetical protein
MSARQLAPATRADLRRRPIRPSWLSRDGTAFLELATVLDWSHTALRCSRPRAEEDSDDAADRRCSRGNWPPRQAMREPLMVADGGIKCADRCRYTGKKRPGR